HICRNGWQCSRTPAGCNMLFAFRTNRAVEKILANLEPTILMHPAGVRLCSHPFLQICHPAGVDDFFTSSSVVGIAIPQLTVKLCKSRMISSGFHSFPRYSFTSLPSAPINAV